MTSLRDQYLGSYRLLGLLASGQTTHVWEAIHDATRQRVAIKRLKAEKPSREHLGLLRHEYEVAKSFDHPRLVKAIEIGKTRGETYLVLELFQAPNMKWWILQGVDKIAYRVPRILDQCAEGMIYLAERGWIHRDIKPDNFLVAKPNDPRHGTRGQGGAQVGSGAQGSVGPASEASASEGDVKLIDFALAEKPKTGLAKWFDFGGAIQGTPSYMAPEQIRNKTLDLKADVYSFGCTIHELISGKKPYTGSRPQELLSKHLGGAVPSLEAANRNVTPAFSALVRGMLDKVPRNRPDIEQVRRELQAIQLFKVPPKEVVSGQ